MGKLETSRPPHRLRAETGEDHLGGRLLPGEGEGTHGTV